tara:strand:- start:2727 stop:3131 length:405 start_codon:yes stop_codon:yes gene_type:complete
MISKVIYKGGLRTEATHLKSGNIIITDAPCDNQGKGEAFSPTDLAATSLASCMLTVMGIKANEMNLKIEGTSAEIEKIMTSQPRRIGQINIMIKLPIKVDKKTREIIERVAMTCPVDMSLSIDVKREIKFQWLS